MECGTEIHVAAGVSSVPQGQQERTHAACPRCGAVHHLFKSGGWARCEGDDRFCRVCGETLRPGEEFVTSGGTIGDDDPKLTFEEYAHPTCLKE